MTAPTTDTVTATDVYDELGGPTRSDAELVRLTADRVQIPRAEPANSFVLHAPLELLARAALLPWVAAEGREPARLRLASLLAQFESEPAAELDDSSVDELDPRAAAEALAKGLASADLEATDRAARAVARATQPHEVAALLGPAVLPSLAAAGHAPIFLYQYPRAAPRGEATMGLLRPLARELARYPQLHISWVADRPVDGTGSAHALAGALQRVPMMGIPGSTFIFPVMHQVDDGGVAAEFLGPALDGVGVDEASVVLLRTAARAMLMGPVEHVPFGWSHTLTMPQAALAVGRSIANPQLAVDVAGTYVVGMIAALATGPIPIEVSLPDPGGVLDDAVLQGRDAAAGWVWHAPTAELVGLPSELATRASARHDAHIVKYTLACLDQVAADPEAARLYLAAAAGLLGFWGHMGEADDPM